MSFVEFILTAIMLSPAAAFWIVPQLASTYTRVLLLMVVGAIPVAVMLWLGLRETFDIAKAYYFMFALLWALGLLAGGATQALILYRRQRGAARSGETKVRTILAVVSAVLIFVVLPC